MLYLEHKSKPAKEVVIQLLLEAALSLHFKWFLHTRQSSEQNKGKPFVPPIPLMIVVYNGDEDWDGEICFQDIYPDLPEELRPYVLQFKIIFINLRRFPYGNIPGNPETQAIVESLKRAADGTFITHLPDILKRVSNANLDELHKLDLTGSISSYCTWVAGATSEQIIKAINNHFQRTRRYQNVRDNSKRNYSGRYRNRSSGRRIER